MSATSCTRTCCRGSDAYRAGTIDAAALHMAEGTVIRDVVPFQKDLGLQAIANGEFRRTCFSLQLDGGKEAGDTKVKSIDTAKRPNRVQRR